MRTFLHSAALSLLVLGNLNAQAPVLERTEAEVQALTKYLIDSKLSRVARFPAELKNRAVYSYSFMSGSHKVYPRENESCLLVVLRTKDHAEGPRTLVFQFTVAPAIYWEATTKAEIDWRDILSGRRVTQYHILEVRKKDGNRIHKDLHLVREPVK